MGNGLSWKIYGKDITDAAGDIDFDVTVGADAGKSIPVDVINNVTGEHSSLNLTLAYDGEFGFAATLTVNMESKNAGLYANLFYYNEQTEELEFISAGQIDPDGNVELVFTHASDYTIVVDAKIMSDNGQADNKSDETIPAPKTDDSTSKYAWNNTIIIIIGICIILIVAYKAILKSDSLKEPQYVETWVYRIVVNEACSFLRSRKESTDVDEIQAASEDTYENIDLKRAIENLDPKDRAIVVLRFFEDRQLEEIAKILDENLSTVKSRLYRVMKKLRLNLEGSTG